MVVTGNKAESKNCKGEKKDSKNSIAKEAVKTIAQLELED